MHTSDVPPRMGALWLRVVAACPAQTETMTTMTPLYNCAYHMHRHPYPTTRTNDTLSVWTKMITANMCFKVAQCMKIRVLLFNNFSVFLQNSQNVSASRFESMYWIQKCLILLVLIMMNLSCKLLMQVLRHSRNPGMHMHISHATWWICGHVALVGFCVWTSGKLQLSQGSLYISIMSLGNHLFEAFQKSKHAYAYVPRDMVDYMCFSVGMLLLCFWCLQQRETPVAPRVSLLK